MSLFKQSALVSGARLADKLLSFVIVWMLSQRFGEEGLGQFNYFFSLVSLFLPLIDMGYGMILLQRWHERDPAGRRLLMTQLVILKAATGSLALFFALGGDAANHWGHANPFAVCAAFAALFFDDFSELFRKPAHAQGQVWIEALFPLVSRLLQLSLLLYFLKDMTDGFQLIYIYAFANAIEMLVSIYGTKDCPPTTLQGSRGTDWWDILKNGAPFAMSGLFVMATLHFDTVMLSHFKGDKTVGIYTAATRIIMVLSVLNGGICHALFPKIIKAKADRDPGHAGWLLNGVLRVFIILFGGIAIGGIVVGQSLMEVVYRGKFNDSGFVFQLLSPLILTSALYSLLGQMLEILGDQRKVMRVYAVSAALNVVGNVVLIPPFGISGSIAATLVSSVYTASILLFAVFKNDHIKMTLFGVGRAVLFLFCLALCYIPLIRMNAWFAVPLGAVIFAALLFTFKNFWLEGMGRLAAGSIGAVREPLLQELKVQKKRPKKKRKKRGG